jgi:enoyl-[acyl-carrier protein] reductase/trans-2-enoyl-CoA reductase (NAD+)
MKEKGGHEGCIEQIYGLFQEQLYAADVKTDEEGRLRMDGKELREEIQQAVENLWPQVTTENIDELTDFAAYQEEFLKLFGFGFDSVDYTADVNPQVAISNLIA